MELKVRLKLNELTEVEANFEGSDIQDAIRSAGALLEFDGKCPFCDNETKKGITLRTRITKEQGYKYTEFFCRDCGAKRSFGKYQEGGFFLKAWEPPYNSNSVENQS